MKIVQNELGKFVGGQDYGICKEGRGQEVEDVKFVFAWSQPCIEYANYLVKFSHPLSTKELAWTSVLDGSLAFVVKRKD